MAQLTFFDSEDRPAQARRLAEKLHGLAERNVFFGTSSWKYEGWLGDIYSKNRYVDPRAPSPYAHTEQAYYLFFNDMAFFEISGDNR